MLRKAKESRLAADTDKHASDRKVKQLQNELTDITDKMTEMTIQLSRGFGRLGSIRADIAVHRRLPTEWGV
jgi:hypothetical protein